MKILVADAIDAGAVERLRNAGHEVEVRTGLKGEALLAALTGCQALIVRGATQVTGEVLRGAPSLRVVARAGSGLDNVDANAARALGIEVRNTPSANAVSVAELTIGLLLAVERHFVPAGSALAAGRWEKQRFVGREIAGRRLGVVGFGHIGREVATRARAFGMAVVAYDPLLQRWPAGFEWVERATFDALLATSDVVTLHLPLDDATRGMFGARELALMKPDAVLIHCARGGIVDEAALVEALRGARLRAAAIDVFEAEPPPTDHPLLALPNVVVTPHLGASTVEAQRRAGLEAADAVIEALAGPAAGVRAPRA